MKRNAEHGMALVAVMMMLVVMTTVGMGMYKLVESTIGISAAYHRKATTRAMAVATGAMVMESIATSVTAGTAIVPPGLTLNDASFLDDLYGDPGSDIPTDTPDNNPDFTYRRGNIVAHADVDYLQAIPMAGGAIEFASAYDGVGSGQGLGSSFLISEYVRIIATDEISGARTEIRFIADN